MTASLHRVVLVTGVSSGIGRATAALLAASGYRVYGSVRVIKPEAELAGVALVRFDVRDGIAIQTAVQSILQREQHIDAVVNNAGLALIGTVEETDIAQAQDLFDINFFGVARVIQAVLPSMRQRRSGRIINIGWLWATYPARSELIIAPPNTRSKATRNPWTTRSDRSDCEQS